MLVTFGPYVSNLPSPLLEALLDGVADWLVRVVKEFDNLLLVERERHLRDVSYLIDYHIINGLL